MPHSDLTILANPGHGNGATVSLLLATEAIQQITKGHVDVVFPYLGAMQEEVIERRMNRDRDVQVFFDHTLGALVSSLTLRNNDFSQNVADIVAYQEPVQRLARQYCTEGLNARGFGGRSKHFGLGDLDFELNHGSRICILDPSFYFFPCLLSDILKRCTMLPDSDRVSAVGVIDTMEAKYERVFLPRVHTFTWDASWRLPEKACFIPFPRPVTHESLLEVPRKGFMVMPSGVGSAANTLLVEAAAALKAEVLEAVGVEPTVYCPPGRRIPELSGAVEISPEAVAHPNIEFVIGRAGWGTLWECLNAETPFVAIPPLLGDDPEIHFNLQTLESTGMSVLWRRQSETYCRLKGLTGRIRYHLRKIEDEFGTRDGLQILADLIVRGL